MKVNFDSHYICLHLVKTSIDLHLKFLLLMKVFIDPHLKLLLLRIMTLTKILDFVIPTPNNIKINTIRPN